MPVVQDIAFDMGLKASRDLPEQPDLPGKTAEEYCARVRAGLG